MGITIKRFFGAEASGLLCPRCELPLEGHDEARCSRAMSRRYFFGLTVGLAGAAILAPALPQILIAESIPAVNRVGNYILTQKAMAELSLEFLKANLHVARECNSRFKPGFKIGHTVLVRRPHHFTSLTVGSIIAEG